MEFKIREVDESQSKSSQELERELLEKHEKDSTLGKSSEDQELNDQELNDQRVLEFIESKHGRKFSKIEEIFQVQTQEKEKLPEDVEAFLNFKKETGRGLNDFMMINRDLEKMNPDNLLRDYYLQTNPELESEDIDFMIDELGYDEELDSDSDVRKKKIEKKNILAKAKQHFKEQSEKFKAPLESSEKAMSEDEVREREAFKQYVDQSKTNTESVKRKQEWFQKKTDEVFSDKFKGFDFKISEDKVVSFSPGDKDSIKKTNSSVENFLGKFVDKEGLIEDAEGYHKALSVAMNADKFAKHFYELGAAAAVDSQSKKDKNIDFNTRTTPASFSRNGLKIRESSAGSADKLVIRQK